MQNRGKKWRYPFKEHRLELLNAHLEQLKSVLSLLLNVLLHGRIVQNEYITSSPTYTLLISIPLTVEKPDFKPGENCRTSSGKRRSD
jgi:hypothetical protein